MPVFRDDDTGYLDWLNRNPSGLVVNTRLKPDKDYFVLHRATCGAISRSRPDPEAYTGKSYIKLTGQDESELTELIAKVIGKACNISKKCGLCKP